jgi:hypothetical protein
LGQWVATQRKTRKKGRLSQEHVDRLDQLGFEWVRLILPIKRPASPLPPELIELNQRWAKRLAELRKAGQRWSRIGADF